MQPFWAHYQDLRLAALWRTGASASQVWVLCMPFAEEEKSARRMFTEIAKALQANGHSSLLFSYSGTGDSEGDFAEASLKHWQNQIVAMCDVARQRAPQAELGLLGLRLGATLAAQAAEQCNATKLWMLEPVLDGKAYLAQLAQRRQLRSMLSGRPKPGQTGLEDMDGWALGARLKSQLQGLRPGKLPLPSQTQLWQIGARRTAAPDLSQWCLSQGIVPKVLLMPPFWNRLDAVSPKPLLEALGLSHDEVVNNSIVHPPKSPFLKGGWGDFVRYAFQQTFASSYTLKNPPVSPFKKGDSGIFTLTQNLTSSPPHLQLEASFQSTTASTTPLLIPGTSGMLVGMLHLPAQHKSTFVLMLHGWSGYRTGPHQMQTRAARRFAKQGFPVLRFDFAGRGDSDGDAELATLATMLADVETALQWIKRTFPSHQVVLSGLCSGCEVAFAAAALPQVAGLMLWSPPVFAAAASLIRTRRKRWSQLQSYATKLLRVSTYGKLLRGKFHPRGVAKVLLHQGGEAKNIENGLPGQLPRGWRQSILKNNQELQLPVLLVFGSADPTATEAFDWYRDQFSSTCRLQTHWVQDANHSYYGLTWEKEVLERSGDWLEQNFGMLSDGRNP